MCFQLCETQLNHRLLHLAVCLGVYIMLFFSRLQKKNVPLFTENIERDLSQVSNFQIKLAVDYWIFHVKIDSLPPRSKMRIFAGSKKRKCHSNNYEIVTTASFQTVEGDAANDVRKRSLWCADGASAESDILY